MTVNANRVHPLCIHARRPASKKARTVIKLPHHRWGSSSAA